MRVAVRHGHRLHCATFVYHPCMSALKISAVYGIRSPSGRLYIGSSKVVAKRWSRHVRDLRRGVHHCKPLQRAADKYGLNTLRIEILHRCAADELFAQEQVLIDFFGFDNLYNVSTHAAGPRGWHWTPEEREAIGARQRGRKATPEQRAHMSAAQRGRKPTPEAIENMRKAARPPLTAEQKAKIGAAHKGRPKPPAALAKRRATRSSSPYPFVVYDKSRDQWIARPKVAGCVRNIGRFKTALDAYSAIIAHGHAEVGFRPVGP